MACSGYPTKADAQGLKTNADTINEVVTSTDDLTPVAIDGQKKRTLAGINTLADDQRDAIQLRSDTQYADTRNRFAYTGDAIAWAAGLVISQEFQRYSTGGSPGDSGYVEWLPDPLLLPFTTSATFAEDQALNRWDDNSNATKLFAQEQARAGDSQIVNGLIARVGSTDLLPLGAQSSVISESGVTRIRVDTGNQVKGELLYLWKNSGDFGATTHTISNIVANAFDGYDVTTEHGTFEFSNSITDFGRSQGFAEFFGMRIDKNIDDSAQVQRACDEGFAKVTLPPGMQKFSNISIYSNQTIEGVGAGYWDEATQTTVQDGVPITHVVATQLSVPTFVIRATAQNIGDTSDPSKIRNYCRIGKMFIKSNWDGASGSPVGIKFEGVNTFSISDFHHMYDLVIEGFFLQVQITGRQIWATYDRVELRGGSSGRFGMEADCDSFNLNAYNTMRITGMRKFNFKSNKSQGLTFSSCNFERSGLDNDVGTIGVELQNSESARFINCYLENHGKDVPIDNVNFNNNSKSLAFTGDYCYSPQIEGGYIVGSGVNLYIDVLNLFGGKITSGRLQAYSEKCYYIKGNVAAIDNQQVPFIIRCDSKVDNTGDFIEAVIDGNGRSPVALEQVSPDWFMRDADSKIVNLFRARQISTFPQAGVMNIDTIENMIPGAELLVYNASGSYNTVINAALMARGVAETIAPAASANLRVVGFPTGKFIKI